MRLRRGFTLIEMLIVIAMMSIMAGAGIAVYTAPAEEQLRANEDSAREAGLAPFFTRLQADCADAIRATVSDGNIELFATDSAEAFAVYTVRDNQLSVKRGGEVPAVLYDRVAGFEPELLDGGQRIRVTVHLQSQSPVPTEHARSGEFTIGRPWLKQEVAQ